MVRNKQQLEQYFKQFKEKKEKEKQLKKQQAIEKHKQYQIAYRALGKQLKEEERLKAEKLKQELQALNPKKKKPIVDVQQVYEAFEDFLNSV